MASIDKRSKRPDKPWRARWREYAGGPQRTKHFERKVDAERFLVDVQHRLLTGAYTPPEAGQVRVADYVEDWLARRRWAPATTERIQRELRLYILPTFGQRPLASIRRPHIEEWAKELPLAPSSARIVYETLSHVLQAAVDDERIARNPARGARLATSTSPPLVPLTDDEVRAVAHGMVEHIRTAVVVAAGTGLRQGELFGLCLDRIDFIRRVLRVDQQLWTPARGGPELKSPKSKNSYRTVAISGVVVDALAAHIGAFDTGRDGLVFHTEGRPVGRSMASKYIRMAVRAASLERHTWHDLRHYHASTLLSAGVSPALVAERLGHDVRTLLSTYAHVIRADEDNVRAIVDRTLGDSAEDLLRTREG